MDDTERPVEEPFGPDEPDFTDDLNEDDPVGDEAAHSEADDQT